jgi:hypothetical protein
MSNMLASDLANPEFLGAHHPDIGLSVLFYSKPMQNNFRTDLEQRPIFEDCDMVRITTPGDPLNIIDTFATDHYKKRFKRQWDFYSSKREGDQRLEGKTPLSAWSRLTPAQVEEFRHLKFLCVEDVAFASDAQIQSIGMAGGMGGSALRDAAKSYLQVAKDSSALNSANQQMAEMRAEMAKMHEQMQSQFAMLAQQTAVAVEPQAPQEDQAAPRRGRPPKE